MRTQNKILAVDDDPHSIAIMEELLGEDFDLKTASTGKEALEIALDFIPDIILLDIMMSGMNGYEVCRRLREHSALRYTNIIMVSAKVVPQERLQGYDAGADDYITKPFEDEELIAKVRIYLGLSCQLREACEKLVDVERDLEKQNETLEKTLGEIESQVEKRTRRLSKENILLEKEIIERKQIEDALRSSEANLRKVIRASPEGIIILNKNKIMSFANPAAESLFDRESEELLGGTLQFPVVLDETTEIEIIRKRGEVAIAEMHIVEMDWERQAAYLVSLHNITERKKAEEKIKEAMEIKSKFVSMASHELRTPLTAIKEGIRLVTQEKSGALNEEQKGFLSIARRNVNRLARLIDDVLDFQKLEAGRMSFNTQQNNINEIVKDVYDTMAPAVKRMGVDFVLKLESNLPKVKFDGDKVAQVITNMVSNAMKFTEKGNITIATSKGENVIQVSVSDTGCGIRKEDLPRVFDEFEQLGQGGDRRVGGTGLGLAISKAIIEQHRGKICVKSEYAKGTTFHFVLPIKERRSKERGQFGERISKQNNDLETILQPDVSTDSKQESIIRNG